MTADRCDWSDLPREMCGHCQGAPAPIAPPEVRPASEPRGRLVWTPFVDRVKREPQDWHDGDKPPAKASPCRYVPEWGYYLREHEPTCRERNCEGCLECTHDDHGTPVRHCTARETCAEHLGPDHRLTCPRCIARVRANLAHIERLSALMLDNAIARGIESEPANLAGPAAQPAQVAEIREYVRHHIQHWLMTDVLTVDEAMRVLAALPEDDDRHPYTLLGRWELMLAEDYGHERKGRITISSSASYLSWLLTDFAQDQEQDFPLFAREIAECRAHLENVLGASRAPERGAPCWRCPTHRETCTEPECEGCRPRLVRRRAHWCDREDCKREHDVTGARDTWVCPVNQEHWWNEGAYRQATYTDAVTAGMKPRRREDTGCASEDQARGTL